ARRRLLHPLRNTGMAAFLLQRPDDGSAARRVARSSAGARRPPADGAYGGSSGPAAPGRGVTSGDTETPGAAHHAARANAIPHAPAIRPPAVARRPCAR